MERLFSYRVRPFLNKNTVTRFSLKNLNEAIYSRIFARLELTQQSLYKIKAINSNIVVT